MYKSHFVLNADVIIDTNNTGRINLNTPPLGIILGIYQGGGVFSVLSDLAKKTLNLIFLSDQVFL